VEGADTVRPADAADVSAVCLPTDASVRLLNVVAVVVHFVKGVYRYLFPVKGLNGDKYSGVVGL